MCAVLQLALGIEGKGVYEDYEDGRKDPSFAVRNYCYGLKKGRFAHLRGANINYRRDGLKYVVEASLKSCEAWGRSGGRN